jgi:hypothetical protein
MIIAMSVFNRINHSAICVLTPWQHDEQHGNTMRTMATQCSTNAHLNLTLQIYIYNISGKSDIKELWFAKETRRNKNEIG